MEIVDVYNYIIQLNIKQLNIILKAVNFFAKCSILYVRVLNTPLPNLLRSNLKPNWPPMVSSSHVQISYLQIHL